MGFYQRNPYFAIPRALRTLAFMLAMIVALMAGKDQGFLVVFSIMLVTFSVTLLLMTLGVKYGYIRRSTPREILPKHLR